MSVNWKAVQVAALYGALTGFSSAVSVWAIDSDHFNFGPGLLRMAGLALMSSLVGAATNVRNLLAQPPEKAGKPDTVLGRLED